MEVNNLHGYDNNIGYIEIGEQKKFDAPGEYTIKDRKKIPAKDFGDSKNKKFPIVTQADVYDAATLIGHAKNPNTVKKNIIKIAKRKGFKLPKSWEAELNNKEE